MLKIGKKYPQPMDSIPKFNECRAYNKAKGPGKILKLINVWSMFIPD